MSDAVDVHRHWSDVHRTKAPEETSWHQARPSRSVEWIERARDVALGASGEPARDATTCRVIDVGAGSSSLVDELLARDGYEVTVLDVAGDAFERTRGRLGERASAATFEVGDVRTWTPGPTRAHAFDVWHDRALLHFMTSEADRAAYRATLEAALRPGGCAVLATFAEDGPERCSGLPVRRHDEARLAETLGAGWEILESIVEPHETPWGAVQRFRWFLVRRRPDAR